MYRIPSCFVLNPYNDTYHLEEMLFLIWIQFRFALYAAVGATSNTLKRKLQKVEDMIDVEPETQRPLYTYSSPSFKKMINTVRPLQPTERFNILFLQATCKVFSFFFLWLRVTITFQSRNAAGPLNLKESFFNTSGVESEELDYKKASDMDVNIGISAFSGSKTSSTFAHPIYGGNPRGHVG